MPEYTLYLDESDVKGELKCFCLCGCVIEASNYVKIEKELENLKKQFFGDDFKLAMHEYEIRRKEKYPYTILQNEKTNREFWDGLRSIFRNNDYSIISTAINKENYHNLYPMEGKVRNLYYVALQMVMESYVYFLERNNAIGHIIAEDRSDSKKLASHFYSIMANGTLYLSRGLMQEKIKGLSFYGKKENIYGLQLADFIANPINRHCSEYMQTDESIIDIVLDKLYDGGCDLANRFGLRQLLCTNP